MTDLIWWKHWRRRRPKRRRQRVLNQFRDELTLSIALSNRPSFWCSLFSFFAEPSVYHVSSVCLWEYHVCFPQSKSKQKLIRLSKRRKEKQKRRESQCWLTSSAQPPLPSTSISFFFSSPWFFCTRLLLNLRQSQHHWGWGDETFQCKDFLFTSDQWPRQSVNIGGFGGNSTGSPFIKCSQVILVRDLVGKKKWRVTSH